MSTIGRYQIRRELGRGGMATVYLAFDPRFDREVAIKVLPREFLHEPTFRARFEREAKLIAALEDPAIVPVYDFGEEAGQPYLVMRYMAGGSLSDRLQAGPLPLGEAVALLTRLAPALDKAHRSGVVHRDLKPANILFDRDGNPYIADFGIAKLLASSATFTATGIVGTPAYMSPEQVEGELELDGRSDVYALGIILYEMLAGQPPYRADTPMSVALMHVRKPTPHVRQAVPGLSEAVDRVVATALAKDRNQRYPTAGALAAALAQAAGSAVPPTRIVPPPRREQVRPPTPPPPVAPPPRSPAQPARQPRWSALVLGLVGMLAVIVVLIVATLGGGDGGPATPTATTPPVIAGGNGPASEPTSTGTPDAVATETPFPATHTPTPTDTLVPPTDTSTPTYTPTATPKPTPTPNPDAVVNAATVNLRSGPGTAYDRLGSYGQGTALTVVGRNQAGNWLKVETPDGKSGWMARNLLRVNVGLDQVAVVTPPPTPTRAAVAAGDMVFVPAGDFTMGSPEGQGYSDEWPQHTVYLDAFYIDKTEVTVAQYRRCVEAGACSTPVIGGHCTYDASGKSDDPINCVDWNQASAFCSWAGKRLPTEAEWEKAARGTDGRVYPWGNAFDGRKLNFCDSNCSFDWKDASVNDGYALTAPVGSYPSGASPYGALDMAGNVWEWVADWYDSGYYAQSPRNNPTGPGSGDYRVLRGGSWGDDTADGRAASRLGGSPVNRDDFVGFRCARSS